MCQIMCWAFNKAIFTPSFFANECWSLRLSWLPCFLLMDVTLLKFIRIGTRVPWMKMAALPGLLPSLGFLLGDADGTRSCLGMKQLFDWFPTNLLLALLDLPLFHPSLRKMTYSTGPHCSLVIPSARTASADISLHPANSYTLFRSQHQ